MVYRTNFSDGYIVEYNVRCFDSWLLLPGENLWDDGVLGFLYILALLYLFLGIAIVADIFMSTIEVITSKKRKVTKYDLEKQESVEIEVFVWNETVANLTLMALGSSAPEILLAVVETIQTLGDEGSSQQDQDGLGTFTIIGSASFNLLIITAICIISVPKNTVKSIREFGVFLLTALWSMFAYVWLLVVLKWSSPDVVELWEALVTLAFFPLFVLTAWCQEHGWWYKRARTVSVQPPQVRVLGLSDSPRPSIMLHRSMELSALEQQRMSVSETDIMDITKSKDKLRDIVNLWKGQNPDENANQTAENVATALQKIKQVNAQPQSTAAVRARFRHVALSSITRKKTLPVQETHNDGQQLNVIAKSLYESKNFGRERDESGRCFHFSSPSYSVLKSARFLAVEVHFGEKVIRSPPVQKKVILPAPYDPLTPILPANRWPTITPANHESNGGPAFDTKFKMARKEDLYLDKSETNSEHSALADDANNDVVQVESVFSVDYETRDGVAKYSKDYKNTQGTLKFKNGETKQRITIPVIPNDSYTKDKDFYVILKNPQGAELGEPNIARMTVIDDDQPGEFSFELANYHSNVVTGDVMCSVVRKKGCDGTVIIQYNSMNGTAVGGNSEELQNKKCDYEEVTDGRLVFQHGETCKQINLHINQDCQNKNFIVLLHDPSPGAQIGQKSATVVHISNDVDDIVDRVANIITAEDEENLTKSWRTQFEEAFTLQGEEREDGTTQPLTLMDFLLHFLTFFWKILFAFIPPRNCRGGWPAFILSLMFIAALTAVVEQIGKLLGCVVGLKNSVTGITIIAIGTSLPDTFASRTAALHDTSADAAIGNITGSNSVNVFLGLGLPWVISTIYHACRNTKYRVQNGNLSFSVIVFTSCGGCCLVILVLRRIFLKGELGGPTLNKYLTFVLLVLLWVLYVVLSTLMAYDYIPGTI